MTRNSLLMDVKVGESVSIDNGRVIMTLKEKSGQRAKLHFDSETNVNITPVRARAAAEQAKNGISVM